MKNKYLITLLALILISFSVKASKRIEDNPTLKGKHSVAVSLVNFNYAIMYMWSDMTSPVFRNYLNNVIYSYGITGKTKVLCFHIKTEELKVNTDIMNGKN